MRQRIFILLVLTGGLLTAAQGEAATYHVAKTGNNSNSCAAAQNLSTAKLTINGGAACLVGGDTLIIHVGTYNERITPSTSIPSGTAGARTIIKGQTGETVIMQPSGVGNVVNMLSRNFVTLDNLTFDGIGGGGPIIYLGAPINDFILQNSIVKNMNAVVSTCIGTYNGTQIVQNMSFINNEIFNCFNPCADIQCDPSNSGNANAIYMRAGGVLIERNRMHEIDGYGTRLDAPFGSGVNADGIIVRYNVSYNNNRGGFQLGGGNNQVAHNNIAYGNDLLNVGVGGIYILSGNNHKVFNNTFYGNNTTCGLINGGTGHQFTNNICWQNGGGNNFTNNVGGGVTFSNNLTTNPSFINPAAGNFHLQSGSSAINAGISTAPTVTTDFDGVIRPQPAGGAYDIGAFEFVSSGADTTPPLVISRTPASGATGVPISTAVTVVFNEAMNAATITTSTILLQSPGPVTVPASVSYNAGTMTATLTPTSPLSPSTVYTITAESGVSGVKDVAGNALVTDATSTFTTAAPVGPVTYYVAKTGHDTNNDCTEAQSAGTPKLTITAAFGCIGTTAGAGTSITVEVGAGNYAEHLNESVNGGTSWANALIVRASAAAVAGAGVWLTPSGAATTVRCITLGSTALRQYVIFDGINCNAAAAGGPGLYLGHFSASSGHIQVTNAEIKNGGEGGNVWIGGTDIRIDHNNIHHTQTATDGILVYGTNAIIEYNDIHDNGQGGIDNYSDIFGVSNNIYRYNRVHLNGAASAAGFGVFLGAGDDNLAYNNLVYLNTGDGVQLGSGGTNNRVYNNTVWSNTKIGMGRCIQIGVSPINTIARNNICWQNTTDTPQNQGTGTIFSNNLTTNPLFVNTATADFHLQTGSAAIDTGTSTAPTVTTDFEDVDRPQGVAYDIGAFEFTGPPTPPPPTQAPGAPTGVTIQ